MTPDQAIKQARDHFEQNAVQISHMKLCRLVRRYMAAEARGDFLTWYAADARGRRIADPTGEQAIRSTAAA